MRKRISQIAIFTCKNKVSPNVVAKHKDLETRVFIKGYKRNEIKIITLNIHQQK